MALQKLLIACFIVGVAKANLYKRSILDGDKWPKYIFETHDSNIQTKIECAAVCQALGHDSCHLFRFDGDNQNCHLGKMDNADTAYLSTQSGSHSVYMSLGTFHVAVTAITT